MAARKSSRHSSFVPDLEFENEVGIPKIMPSPVDGTLRQYALRVPEIIDECSGIVVFGKKIKSLVFSTDLAIIKNINADAVLAVYPFTPQPVISEALLLASDIPVFVAAGSQTPKIVKLIKTKYPNMPVIATGGKSDESIRETIEAGANAISYTPASTAELFKSSMERYRKGLPHE